MHRSARSILSIFKENPGSNFSTSQLVNKIYSITSPKLHRRLLYHLNHLKEAGIIDIIDEKNKGEKVFTIKVNSGEELLIKDKHKPVRISKQSFNNFETRKLEEEKIIERFYIKNWTKKINCILLRGNLFDSIEQILSYMKVLSFSVNDVIGITDFSSLIETEEKTKKLIEEIKLIGEQEDLIINLIFKINDIKKIKKEMLRNLIAPNIKITISTEENIILDYYDFFKEILLLFKDNQAKLFFQKENLIVGKERVYKIPEKMNLRSKCIVTDLLSLQIDIDKIVKKYGFSSTIRKVFSKAAKTVFKGNLLQREYFDENYETIFSFISEEDLCFNHAKNNILIKTDNKNDIINSYLDSIKKSIGMFCIQQEIILKSCGIPTNFKIAFDTISEKKIKTVSVINNFSNFQEDLICFDYTSKKEREVKLTDFL
jgi:hypothetical protein